MSSIEDLYNLKFFNHVIDGRERISAIKDLKSLFKLNDAQLKSLLGKKEKIVKEKISYKKATTMSEMLRQAGWKSEIIPQSKNTAINSKNTPVKISTSEPQKNIKVPKLDTINSTSDHESISVPIRRIFDEEKSISICLPEHWIGANNLNSSAIIQAHDTAMRSYCIILQQNKAEFKYHTSLQSYHRKLINQAENTIQSSKIYSINAQHPHAHHLLVTSEVKGLIGDIGVHYVISSIEDKENFYSIYFWCAEEEAEKERKLFHTLLSTCRTHYDKTKIPNNGHNEFMFNSLKETTH